MSYFDFRKHVKNLYFPYLFILKSRKKLFWYKMSILKAQCITFISKKWGKIQMYLLS